MKRTKLWAVCLCLALTAIMTVSVCAEEAETEAAVEAEEAGNQLSAPTDFTFDPETGTYSFNMTDERMAYYFIRVYALADGEETGEYVATSKRINGGTTGEVTGTVNLDGLAWGSYHVNLVSFAPAGTDYVKPDVQSITLLCGKDLILERPEFMVMTSGNTAEVIIDWYTLSDYYEYAYLPEMQISFYADADCTEEVLTDLVDLSELVGEMEPIPPMQAYAWGFSMSGGDHIYTVQSVDGFTGEEMEVSFSYINDIYTYQLDPGTYYVTCQALARDEYTQDSQVSDVVEITLTDGESSTDYEAVQSSLWEDPIYGVERIIAQGGVYEDRIDVCTAQIATLELLE